MARTRISRSRCPHGRLGLNLLHLRGDFLHVAAERLLFVLLLQQIAAGPGNLAGRLGIGRRVLDLQPGHHDHDNHDADDAGHDIEERIGIDGFFLFDGVCHSYSVIIPPTQGRWGHSILHPSVRHPSSSSLILIPHPSSSHCFLSITSPLPSSERVRSSMRGSAPGTT